MRQTRQLAAIMFTDIVGYTALMGKDERQAFDLLKKNREIQKPLIKKFQGTWIKEIGDGELASFHTVTDAVFCAAAIHEACTEVKGLQLRIGIHLGEVIFEDDDIFGDGVNIASRLQAMASPGSTWVSEAIHKNLVNKKEITSKFVKEETLKNVSELVKIYEISVKEPLKHLPDSIQTYQSKTAAAGPSKNKIAYIATLIVLLGLVVSYFLFMIPKSGPGTSSKIDSQKSIAVLPFKTLSDNKDDQYFADGMMDEILNKLSKISGLKVIARTSVEQYRGTMKTMPEIAGELNVAYILEGSAQKHEDEIKIIVQLIRGASNDHAWASNYTRPYKEVFKLQNDIATIIAEELQVAISPETDSKINRSPTKNTEAYDYYLQARYIAFNQYYYQWSDSLAAFAFDRSRILYEKAIETDPGFALAYAGLSDLYDAKRNSGDRSAKVDSLRQNLGRKAYQLDPNSAFVNNVRIWNFANRNEPVFDSALYHARKALLLEPEDFYNSFAIGALYSNFPFGLNLHELSVPFFKRSVKLNSLDVSSFAELGFCYFYLGEIDKSNSAFQSAYRLTTTNTYFGIWHVMNWLIRSGKLEEAERLLEKQNWGKAHFTRLLLLMARNQEDEVLKQIPNMGSGFDRAYFYALLAKKEACLNELKQVNERVNLYPWLNNEPYLKYHDDPEFQKILAMEKAQQEEYINRYVKYAEGFNDED